MPEVGNQITAEDQHPSRTADDRLQHKAAGTGIEVGEKRERIHVCQHFQPRML